MNGIGRNARLRRFHQLLLIVVLVLALAGCTGASVTPTAVPTEAPTSTPLPISGATATREQPTPTIAIATDTAVLATPVPATASPTAAPSATATAAPTETPVPPTGGPPPVAITEFSAAPAEIAPGGSVTLSWQAIAEWATVYLADERGRLTEPSYEVPISGTLVVTTSTTLRDRADFFLFAGSGNVYEQAMASVLIPCPDAWFIADPPAGCPLAPHFPTMAAQRFEHGLLLWLQATDDERPFNEIIALYDDDGPLPRWQTMVDDWTEGEPESDPDIVPPDGLFQPVRGFGKIWSQRTEVRDRLGWATGEEFSLEDGGYQCSSAAYASCYVSGPEGVVYVLYPNGSDWDAWAGVEPAP